VDVAKTIIDSIANAKVVVPTVLPVYVNGLSDDPFQLTDDTCITGVFLRLLLGSSFYSYRHLKTTSDVANSSADMNVVANSSTALDIMRTSNTAIAAVHDSTAGRNILSQSEHLFKWFWTYEIAEYGLLNTPTATTTETITTFGSLSGTYKWSGSVIAPNGYVYGTPRGATTVLKINPQNDAITTFGSLSGTEKWIGSVVAPNGYVYGTPRADTTVLKINPQNDAITTFGSLSGTDKWYGSVVAPNGYVYGTPRGTTTVLKISFSPATYKAELGSPYYNKF
jgi:hypothetical protein